MNEIWRKIDWFCDDYKVSNLGRIKSFKKNKIDGELLRPCVRYGYWRVSLSINNRKKYFLVHRLVATAFIDNPDNYPFVDHIDKNTLNSNVSNLQWVTAAQNNKLAFDRGRPPVKSWLGKSGSEHNKSKKVKCLTLDISFGSTHEAARVLGVQQSNVSQVCRGNKLHIHGLHFKYI